jgi:hypothetical protein
LFFAARTKAENPSNRKNKGLFMWTIQQQPGYWIPLLVVVQQREDVDAVELRAAFEEVEFHHKSHAGDVGA